MPKAPCWDRVSGRDVHVDPSGLKWMLGSQPLTALDMWRLAMAIDGTKVSVERLFDEDTREFRLIGTNGSDVRTFSCPSEWQIVAHTIGATKRYELVSRGYYLKKETAHEGHAWAALALQVHTAHRLGFTAIVAETQGGANSSYGASQYTGYYSAPRLGFDGMVPSHIWRNLDANVLSRLNLSPDVPDNVSKLMATKTGRELWRERGAGFTVRLVLDPLDAGAKALLGWLSPWPPHVE